MLLLRRLPSPLNHNLFHRSNCFASSLFATRTCSEQLRQPLQQQRQRQQRQQLRQPLEHSRCSSTHQTDDLKDRTDTEIFKKLLEESATEKTRKRKAMSEDYERNWKAWTQLDIDEGSKDGQDEDEDTLPEVNPDMKFGGIIQMGRHIKVTKQGRRESYSCFLFMGNGNASAAYGYGKGISPKYAVKRAQVDANKHLVHVVLEDDRTVFRSTKTKFVRTFVKIWKKPKGYGIRAGALMTELCLAFGIKDIAIQVAGRRNKINTVKAFFKALLNQESDQEKAKRLGKVLFDTSKVTRRATVTHFY